MKGKEERKRGGDGGRKMSVFQCDTYSVLPVLMSTHWSHMQLATSIAHKHTTRSKFRFPSEHTANRLQS